VVTPQLWRRSPLHGRLGEGSQSQHPQRYRLALATYAKHGRIKDGSRDEMLEGLYSAWKADIDRGLHALMIASDTATVNELNARARADRVASGAVIEEGVDVAGLMTAGVNDLVVTRENNRRLTANKSWVKNGDVWTVSATNTDGSMTVTRVNGNDSVVLPARYVADHVELAYATTAHRAQGRTVDTAHAFVSPTATAKCSTSPSRGARNPTISTSTRTTTPIHRLDTTEWPRYRAPQKCSQACCATKDPTSPRPT